MRAALFLFGALALVLGATPAAADYGLAVRTVNSVGFGLMNLGACGAYADSSGFACIVLAIVIQLRWIVIPVATLTVVITGIRMIVGQEDEALDKAKGAMSASVAGIILSFLVEPFAAAFYWLPINVGIAQGVRSVNEEVGGVLDWVLFLAGPIAITMIVLSAIKALTKPEEGVANIRKAIVSVLAGMLVLFFRFAIADSFGISPTPRPVLAALIDILVVILGLMALGATAIIIYAGMMLILNFGSDDQLGKSKSLIIRAVIGLIMILVSGAIVEFVIGAAL